MTAPQAEATTNPQSIVAALQQKLDAALSEKAALAEALAQRNSEFGERIEHQAATIDVLKTMSASPGDPQPVFDLIARQAANQCNVPTAAVGMFDGKMMHLATQSGFDAAYEAQFPRPVGLDFSMGRAVLNRRVDQVEDLTADPGHSFAPVLGPWSVIAVPILRNGQPLGAISIGRPAMGPFSASQVALLQTFAEQAVIAITSAETYRALQERTKELAQRNSEYGERIEHQSATIDVLKAMSASPGDAQPVFELIAKRSRELCEATIASLHEFDGELVYYRASVGANPQALSAYASQFSMKPLRSSIACRAIIDKRIIHIRDVDADAEALHAFGQKSQVSVPLMKDSAAIGAISLGASKLGGFSDTQIELLRTFAEQRNVSTTMIQPGPKFKLGSSTLVDDLDEFRHSARRVLLAELETHQIQATH